MFGISKVYSSRILVLTTGLPSLLYPSSDGSFFLNPGQVRSASMSLGSSILPPFVFPLIRAIVCSCRKSASRSTTRCQILLTRAYARVQLRATAAFWRCNFLNATAAALIREMFSSRSRSVQLGADCWGGVDEWILRLIKHAPNCHTSPYSPMYTHISTRRSWDPVSNTSFFFNGPQFSAVWASVDIWTEGFT